MARLAQTFDRLRERREAALVAFVMGGDPTLDALPDIVGAVVEGGADIVEVGLPYSDPIADGPVIQASSFRSLQNGATVAGVLEAVSRCEVDVPIVLMGYANLALSFGNEAFVARAKAAGASGAILSDLPSDDAADWLAVCRKADFDTIFLAAPTSTDKRLAAVAQASSGFVYAVSRTGVTGAAMPNESTIEHLVGRIRAATDLPVCVGFGLRTPDQVASVVRSADGAVVGSAIVEWVAANWERPSAPQELSEYIRTLKAACNR